MLSGAALYGWTYYEYARHDWTPLSMPISLTPGSLQTKEFRLDRGLSYDVLLHLDPKTIDQQRMACLSGSEPESEAACKNTPTVVDISWAILENGGPVAVGNSRDFWGGNSFERLLGPFQPTHDGRYTLSVEIHKDASVLAVAHPELQVVIDLFERDGLAMSVGFGELEATVVFASGLCLSLLGAVPKILRRRRERSAAT
jgi:hypothetical protein